MSTDPDYQRLESKIDKLTDAVMRLVLIEERQSIQGERIDACETRLVELTKLATTTDRKLERWINRGIGAWAVACSLFALVQFGVKFI
jgi:hypothetical protein